MLLNVADLKAIGSSLEVQVRITGDAFPEIPLLAPIAGKIMVTFRGDKYVVSGELETTVELECRRCLGKFPYIVKVNFQELYQRGNPVLTQGFVELQEEELNTFFFQGDYLDLTDSIRENILVSLPWNPLCHDNCRGLCPTCGINLNFVDCQCSNKRNDLS